MMVRVLLTLSMPSALRMFVVGVTERTIPMTSTTKLIGKHSRESMFLMLKQCKGMVDSVVVEIVMVDELCRSISNGLVGLLYFWFATLT